MKFDLINKSVVRGLQSQLLYRFKGIPVNLGKTYKTRVDKGSARSSMKGKPWSEARILAQLNRRLRREV